MRNKNERKINKNAKLNMFFGIIYIFCKSKLLLHFSLQKSIFFTRNISFVTKPSVFNMMMTWSLPSHQLIGRTAFSKETEKFWELREEDGEDQEKKESKFEGWRTKRKRRRWKEKRRNRRKRGRRRGWIEVEELLLRKLQREEWTFCKCLLLLYISFTGQLRGQGKGSFFSSCDKSFHFSDKI